MKYLILLFVVFISLCDSPSTGHSGFSYFDLIKQAEMLICEENFSQAAMKYEQAFDAIDKPFGKDVFNAALVYQLSNQADKRDQMIQFMMNNSDELEFVESVFVGTYLTEEDWQTLLANRTIEYDSALREEFKEISARDQLFRPDYETYDDTINANRQINLARILDLTDSIGFPSQVELGYTSSLQGQEHDIVLHHTAQRRSYDKTVVDLEPILYDAVQAGRFDPDQAIFYLNFQNDSDKGPFEVYSTWQYMHPLLPDSLTRKVWVIDLSEEQKARANEIRQDWGANTLKEIVMKSIFLTETDLPFIFTCVKKSIMQIQSSVDQETALAQYEAFTGSMEGWERE